MDRRAGPIEAVGVGLVRDGARRAEAARGTLTALRTSGVVTENTMVAHEPSHFSQGGARRTSPGRRPPAITASDGSIVGELRGSVRALSPTESTVVVRAPGETAVAADVPSFRSVDLVLDVQNGVADVTLIGVDTLEEQVDGHGGVSGGAQLTTLFSAEAVPITLDGEG